MLFRMRGKGGRSLFLLGIKSREEEEGGGGGGGGGAMKKSPARGGWRR